MHAVFQNAAPTHRQSCSQGKNGCIECACWGRAQLARSAASGRPRSTRQKASKWCKPAGHLRCKLLAAPWTGSHQWRPVLAAAAQVETASVALAGWAGVVAARCCCCFFPLCCSLPILVRSNVQECYINVENQLDMRRKNLVAALPWQRSTGALDRLIALLDRHNSLNITLGNPQSLAEVNRLPLLPHPRCLHTARYDSSAI